jgi:hypothetical protein
MKKIGYKYIIDNTENLYSSKQAISVIYDRAFQKCDKELFSINVLPKLFINCFYLMGVKNPGLIEYGNGGKFVNLFIFALKNLKKSIADEIELFLQENKLKNLTEICDWKYSNERKPIVDKIIIKSILLLSVDLLIKCLNGEETDENNVKYSKIAFECFCKNFRRVELLDPN